MNPKDYYKIAKAITKAFLVALAFALLITYMDHLIVMLYSY